MFGQLRLAHSGENRKARGRLALVGGLTAGVALVLSPLSASAATHHHHQTKTVVELSEAQNGTLGTILTNSHGLTLYTFTQDTPNKSNCFGACAKIWPPLIMSKGEKIKSLKGVRGIGTIPRGKELQLTFDQKPLYLFAGDKTAGMTTGQGVENAWFVVVLKALAMPAPTSPPAPAPAGAPEVSTHSSGSSSHSSSGSSSGSTTPAPTSPAPTSPPPTSPPPTTPPPTSPPPVVVSPPPAPSPPPPSGGGGIGY
jgi:predicted lipoprotein with Yx(FWY)xxD motif